VIGRRGLVWEGVREGEERDQRKEEALVGWDWVGDHCLL